MEDIWPVRIRDLGWECMSDHSDARCYRLEFHACYSRVCPACLTSSGERIVLKYKYCPATHCIAGTSIAWLGFMQRGIEARASLALRRGYEYGG